MDIWEKLGDMTPVCDGADSSFSLEQSLVIILFVLWLSALAKLYNKFGHNSCILVVSQPLEALRRSTFSNLAATRIWSCDLWWRIEIKPFALYLIN